MKKIIISLLFVFFISACETAREGLTLKKTDNSDEFLVEKKNPLVLPPNYGELPLPSEEINEEDDEIQITMGSEKIEINEKPINSEPTSLEKSIIEKIN